MRSFATALLALVVPYALGCKDKGSDTSSEEEADADADAAGDTDADSDADSDVDWETATFAERQVYMAEVVTPAMKTLFQSFDSARFADFDCGTCHGAGASDGTFTMPNPSLPKLHVSDFPDPGSSDPEEAAWAAFMFDQVTPAMVELLGEEPYDYKTGEGFGCFGCHTAL